MCPLYSFNVEFTIDIWNFACERKFELEKSIMIIVICRVGRTESFFFKFEFCFIFILIVSLFFNIEAYLSKYIV